MGWGERDMEECWYLPSEIIQKDRLTYLVLANCEFTRDAIILQRG